MDTPSNGPSMDTPYHGPPMDVPSHGSPMDTSSQWPCCWPSNGAGTDDSMPKVSGHEAACDSSTTRHLLWIQGG